MTNEEAIETIKSNWPDGNYHFTKLREALGLAIEELEKQVPKEVTNRIIINGIILGGNCPNCGYEIGITSYCGYCGQAIKWVEPIHKNGVKEND